MTLDNLPLETEAVITTVGGEGALRCRFLDMGLIPKTKVVVKKIAPMGDPIEIRLRNYELTIRKEDAKKIEVSIDRKSTRLNSSHIPLSRMPSSA